MYYGPTEEEVHRDLDDHFSRSDVFSDEKLSRFHRSWVRKNRDRFYVVKKSQFLTGQPVYQYGSRVGPQYGAKGRHVGWGGSYWVDTWEIHRRSM